MFKILTMAVNLWVSWLRPILFGGSIDATIWIFSSIETNYNVWGS